ncbi:MAG: hypothetical protein ABJA98_11000 [Acidobacteriota bacterium]
MSQILSSKILAGPADTSDPALVITPDTAGPLKPGKYTFSLIVTDDLGMQSAAATLPVEVRDAPGVRLTGPSVVAFNQNINLKADATTTGAIKTYTWSVKQNA